MDVFVFFCVHLYVHFFWVYFGVLCRHFNDIMEPTCIAGYYLASSVDSIQYINIKDIVIVKTLPIAYDVNLE